MGFFFAEAVNNSSKSKKHVPLQTARELGCKICPLKKHAQHPDIQPEGSTRPVVYFLGEAPDIEDEKAQKPFMGMLGRMVRDLVPRSFQAQVRYNNVVRTRTKGDLTPKELEIECCKNSIIEDIETSQPLIVVPLGPIALTWCLDVKDVSKWRGRFVPAKIGKHMCWVYPCYHSAQIVKYQRYNESGQAMRSEWTHIFESDIDVLFKQSINLPNVSMIESNHLKGVIWSEGLKSDKELNKVLTWINEMDASTIVAFDYETNCLRPFEKDARLLTIAIANDKHSYAFPIEYKSAWTDVQLSTLKERLSKFFRGKTKKICHNVKFEMEWTAQRFGMCVLYTDTWEDTQAQAYVLDERRGMLNLDTLIRLHFGFWLKELSNLNRSRMESYPLEKILPYNGLDSKWTLQLYLQQKKRVEQEAKIKKMYQFLLTTSATLTATQIRGVVLDFNNHQQLQKSFQEELDKIKDDIQKLAEVKEFKQRYGMEFNPGSPEHVLRVLDKILNLGDLITKDSGKMSTDESVLSTLTDVELAQYILNYRGIAKKISTYIEPYPGYIMEDGCIHTNYNPYETTTGRLCVAKGTMIEVVRDFSKLPLGIAIEDVKPGDLVYTYNDQLQVTLKPVTWSGITGHKKVMRIHWKGDGNKTSGYLDVTCNHPIRLINGEYVRTDQVCVGDRVLSLTRTIKDGRAFFYQTGRIKVISDQRFVYEQVHGKIPNGYHTHHLDHSTLNNVPENLIILKAQEHASHHSKEFWSHPENIEKMSTTRKQRIVSGEITFKSGEDHWEWKSYTKWQLLRSIAKTRGDITKLEIDYSTFLNKVKLLKINYKHCLLRYSKQKSYLSKAKILNLANSIGPTNIARQFGVDYSKVLLLLSNFGWINPRAQAKIPTKFQLLRALSRARGRVSNLKGGGFSDLYKVKKYAEFFNIDLKTVKKRYTKTGEYIASTCPNNHKITKIEWLNETVDVYDLGVEDTHNFIANGICISNSSSDPNLQNVPSRTGKEIRRMIGVPENHWMVCADYGQIEARIIGVASQDREFCKALWEDYDVHMEWAKRIAEEYPAVIGGHRFLDDKKVMKGFRSKVKNLWVFPAFYGASPHSIAKGLNIPFDVVQPIFKEFWQTFHGVKRWQKWILNRYYQLGYVESLNGRRRHAPMTMNAVLNASIQGFASDICVDALNRLDRLGVNTVMVIHDDITSYVHDDHLEETIAIIAEEMCKVPFPFINVPIAVEITVGKNWFDQEEVGTFKSTDFHAVPSELQDFRKLYDFK